MINDFMLEIVKRIETLEMQIANNLRNKAFGHFWIRNVPEIIAIAAPGVFYPLITGNAGLSNFMTPTIGAPSSRLTVIEGGIGIYLISFSISYTTATPLLTLIATIHVNNILQNNISGAAMFTAAGETANIAGIGLLTLTTNNFVDLRVAGNIGGAAITIDHFQLTAYRIK